MSSGSSPSRYKKGYYEWRKKKDKERLDEIKRKKESEKTWLEKSIEADEKHHYDYLDEKIAKPSIRGPSYESYIMF